jgi:hypothetical protein
MNAGYDLLMATKWDALFEGQQLKSPEQPPLVGMSQFAAAPNNLVGPSAQPAVSLATAGAAPAAAARGHLVLSVVVLLGVGVAFLTAATLVLKARAVRNPR